MTLSKYLTRLKSPKIMDSPVLDSNFSLLNTAITIWTLLRDKGLERAIPALAPVTEKMRADTGFMKRLDDLAHAEERGLAYDDLEDFYIGIKDGAAFTEDELNTHISPFLEALDKHISPQQKIYTKEGKEESFLAWYILRMSEVENLRGLPYGKAEDLYKLNADFETWNQARQRLEEGNPLTIKDRSGKTHDFGTQDTIFHVETMGDLAQIARLETERKDLKKEFKATMRTGSDAPHTVIYDGPEGKIVVPQTMESCQFFGDRTRWCIAARGEEDNMFDDYSRKAPIFVFLPKIPDQNDPDQRNFPDYSSFKFASTNGVLYDEQDKQPSANNVPACVTRLREAAERALTGGALDYFRTFSDPDHFPVSSRALVPDDVPEEWKPHLEDLHQCGFSEKLRTGIPHALRDNIDFLLAAIRIEPEAFYLAPEELQDYDLFQNAAAKANPAAIERMPNDGQAPATRAVQQAITEGKIPPDPRLIHLLPTFYGGPLTTDIEKIKARLESGKNAVQPESPPAPHLG